MRKITAAFSSRSRKQSRFRIARIAGPIALLLVLVCASFVLVGCSSDESSNSTINSIADLKGKTVGTLTGSLITGNEEEFLGEGVEVKYFNTLSDAIASARDGKIDAAMMDSNYEYKILNENPTLRALDEHLGESLICAALPKGTERSNTIREQLNEYIAQAKESGELDELLKKWSEAEATSYTIDLSKCTGEAGELKIATSSGIGLPSATYQNGALAGFDVEVAVRFCEMFGYKPVFYDIEFSSIVTSLSVSKYDVAFACMTYTEERAKSVDFSDPYYEGGQSFFVANGEQSTDNIFESIAKSFKRTFIEADRWKMFADGALTTFLISILSIFLGTILGFILYLFCRRGPKVCKLLVNACIWLVESLPVVVLLMVLFYIVFGSSDIDGVIIATLGFTLVFTASVIGMLRLGVNAVDEGQNEAGLALGYSETRTFFLIILPQALKIVIPKYTGEAISLLKGTAVVGYIAVQDLTKMGDIVRSVTYEAIFPLIAVALVYILLELILRFICGRIERRLNRPTTAKSSFFRRVEFADYSTESPIELKKQYSEYAITMSQERIKTIGETILEFDQVGKRFPNCEPLTSVTATIDVGDVISLIGASGCGKSTLMRCINQLDPATSGHILLRGEDITKVSHKKAQEVRREVGMMFQRWNLFGHWTILENIVRPMMALKGVSKQQACDQTLFMLALYGLADKAFSYPQELSGGQQQRIALIRTAALSPSIILLDEPTSALDPTMVHEVEWLISSMSKNGFTFFIVSHDMQFLRNISSRVFFMADGGIYEQGTAEEIFDHPQLPKTRNLIYQLTNCEYTFENGFADYYTFNSELNDYCIQLRFSERQQFYIENVIEELCLDIIKPVLEKPYRMSIALEHSNKTEVTSLVIMYTGRSFNPFEEGNALDCTLLQHEVDSMKHEELEDDADGYTNRVVMEIKK